MLLVIAVLGVAYHVTLALGMPPVLSADIYHYALFGRMVAFYGLNPYVVPGSVDDIGAPFNASAVSRGLDETKHPPTTRAINATTAYLGDRSTSSR